MSKKSRSCGLSNSTLDKMWSKKVRDLAGNKCELCNCSEGLNAHHINGRKNYNTRWYIGNGICLCNNCHQKSMFSAHKNPVWFISKVLLMRGGEWGRGLVSESARTNWKERLEEIKEALK